MGVLRNPSSNNTRRILKCNPRGKNNGAKPRKMMLERWVNLLKFEKHIWEKLAIPDLFAGYPSCDVLQNGFQST